MKKTIIVLLALFALCNVSVAGATDGFYYTDRLGDPADSADAYGTPTTNTKFVMPIKRLQISTSDMGAAFSSNNALLVVGQVLDIKAFSGFANGYSFVGDSNFAGLFKADGLMSTYIFSGTAKQAGLAEARIMKNGQTVDKVGIQVINPYIVDKSADKQTISMPQYTWLMIKLDTNPSTGYDWQVVSQGGNVNIADSGYMQNVDTPNNNISGAPTQKYFLVQAAAVGNAKLTLQYSRPWEAGSVVGKYELTIEVAAGA